MPGNAERMNGKAKGLNERNTFFICDTVNADQELRKNVRLYSGMSAYLRLMGEKCLRTIPSFGLDLVPGIRQVSRMRMVCPGRGSRFMPLVMEMN